MKIFPAIDLLGGEAVRLFKGDYNKKTVYSAHPVEVARDFVKCGAEYVHLVDLEGAKTGETPNFDVVCAIKKETGMFCEIGGGIRSIETVERYISNGIDRVILGTAALKDRELLKKAVDKYGKKIAVGVDMRDGFVAVNGWLESSGTDGMEFCRDMERIGINTLICTDISKDGAMQGANRELYRRLANEVNINITASGGVSSIEDIKALKEMKLYGAIIGKAYYIGAVSLAEAVRMGKS